jgi:two-component system cell cycle response regulator
VTIAAKILFAHDDHAFGRSLSWILGEHGFEVVHAAADGSVLDLLAAEPRDLLLLETASGPVGLDLLARIKADERFRDLPVVMLSSMSPEEGSVKALGLGAADSLTRPFRTREVLARIKAHLRAGRELNRARAEARSRAEMVEILREIASALSPEEIYRILVRRVAQALGLSRCSILLQGPDPGTGTVVAAFENPLIRDLRVELERYPEIRTALKTGEIVLCDAVGSDPLFAATREEWRTRGHQVETTSALAIPFALHGGRAGVFYLRTGGHNVVLNTLDVQFADQVIKSAVTAIEKAQDLQAAMEGQRELRELAETDPLTGLYNRRALEHRLAREMEQASRYDTALSCLMIDVDSFKVTNDTYGHQVGDVILAQLAALLKRGQRAIDVTARLGGEEFCVLLPLTGSAGARILADRILRRVAGHQFGEPSHPIPVTVSIGIAIHPDDRVTDGASLLRLADHNLLKAKEDGRNRYRD